MMTPQMGGLMVHAKKEAEAITAIMLEAIDTRFMDSPALREQCRYLIEAGGKRIRATIPGMVIGALGGNPAEGRHVGAIVETIHTFTLMHDDIMDDDAERRGVPAAHVKFGPAAAINAGNALFALAIEMVTDETELYRYGHIEEVIGTCFELAEGQQMDLAMEPDVLIPRGDYLKMVQYKTASLFALSALLGAMVADAPDTIQRNMEAWGLAFGMSFQFQDDILDHEIDRIEGDAPQWRDLAQTFRDKAMEQLRHLYENEYTEMLRTLTTWQTDRKE